MFGRRYTTVPYHTHQVKLKMEILFRRIRKGLKPPQGRHWRSSPKKLEKLEKMGLIEWSKNGNPRKIIYADERDGKKRQDIWEFKDSQNPIYPTEKNIPMIESIILNSSNEDSIILDCFCGSGTTLEVASNNNRKWIGIDSSKEAIKIIENRLNNKKLTYNKISMVEDKKLT